MTGAKAAVFAGALWDVEAKHCGLCGRKVPHRRVVAESSLFDGAILFRPVRHCPRCGKTSDRQESEPGVSDVHAPCLKCPNPTKGKNYALDKS